MAESENVTEMTHGTHRDMAKLSERQGRLEQLVVDTNNNVGKLNEAVNTLTRGFTRMMSELREVSATAKVREGRIDMKVLIPVLAVAISITGAAGSYFITPLQTKLEIIQRFMEQGTRENTDSIIQNSKLLNEHQVKLAVQDLQLSVMVRDLARLTEVVAKHQDRVDVDIAALQKSNISNATAAPIVEKYQAERFASINDSIVRLEDRLAKLSDTSVSKSATTEARLNDLIGRMDLLSNRLNGEISRRAADDTVSQRSTPPVK